MFCENCGKKLAEESVFCEYCGTRQKMGNTSKALHIQRAEDVGESKKVLIFSYKGLLASAALLIAVSIAYYFVYRPMQRERDLNSCLTNAEKISYYTTRKEAKDFCIRRY